MKTQQQLEDEKNLAVNEMVIIVAHKNIFTDLMCTKIFSCDYLEEKLNNFIYSLSLENYYMANYEIYVLDIENKKIAWLDGEDFNENMVDNLYLESGNYQNIDDTENMNEFVKEFIENKDWDNA